MKKIFTLLLVTLFSLGITFTLSACDDTNNTPLSEREIGYQVAVYPDFDFDYNINWDNENYLIHIESIHITLVEKNQIQPQQTISGEFYPYAFQVVANAKTTEALSGRLISIRLLKNDTLTMIQTTVKSDGTIEWSQVWHLMSEPQVSFSDILLYNQ